MTISELLFLAWLVVTCALVALLVFRARLQAQKSDWINLNAEDEQRAAQTQSMVELKTGRLRWPIAGLGALSVALLVATISVWVGYPLG